MLTVPLSYAKARRPGADAHAQRAVGARRRPGRPRTNTLIIRDLADRLTAADELINTLDRPQPQVEIEARIVQTTRDFARDLGIQWGFNGQIDPRSATRPAWRSRTAAA